MDPALIARYPFLPDAAAYVRAEGPAIEDLLAARAWQTARSGGKARVLAALEAEPVHAQHARTEHEALVAVLGYVTARLVVSCVGDDYLLNRYATAEARGAGEALAADSDAALVHVAQVLGLRVEHREETDRFALPFRDFLQASKDLSALEWKLVNQDMDRGVVLLKRGRLVRLTQEALKKRLLAELPLDVPPAVAEGLTPWPQEVRTRLEEIRSSQAELSFDKVVPEAFPPCITTLIGAIQRSENVSHEGRFATVSFLNTIGMDRDAIVEELFTNVPDFARDITEYQVDHITGKKGHEAYTPPGCSSLQTYGLCPMMTRAKDDWDGWCAKENMNHPLTYYRWGLFVHEKRSEKEDGGSGAQQREDAKDGSPRSDPS